jgi:hypothetical protein
VLRANFRCLWGSLRKSPRPCEFYLCEQANIFILLAGVQRASHVAQVAQGPVLSISWPGECQKESHVNFAVAFVRELVTICSEAP